MFYSTPLHELQLKHWVLNQSFFHPECIKSSIYETSHGNQFSNSAVYRVIPIAKGLFSTLTPFSFSIHRLYNLITSKCLCGKNRDGENKKRQFRDKFILLVHMIAYISHQYLSYHVCYSLSRCR